MTRENRGKRRIPVMLTHLRSKAEGVSCSETPVSVCFCFFGWLVCLVCLFCLFWLVCWLVGLVGDCGIYSGMTQPSSRRRGVGPLESRTSPLVDHWFITHILGILLHDRSGLIWRFPFFCGFPNKLHENSYKLRSKPFCVWVLDARLPWKFAFRFQLLPS